MLSEAPQILVFGPSEVLIPAKFTLEALLEALFRQFREFPSRILVGNSFLAFLQVKEASSYIPLRPGPIKWAQAWWRQSSKGRLAPALMHKDP